MKHRFSEFHDPNNPNCGYASSIGVASPDADWCSCPLPSANKDRPLRDEEGSVVKRVPRKTHACSPPGYWKRRRLDLGLGSIWQCKHCNQQWLFTRDVFNYWCRIRGDK